jgi:signal transduction histidine kinase
VDARPTATTPAPRGLNDGAFRHTLAGMDDERIIGIARLESAVLLARGTFHQFGNHLTLVTGYASLVRSSLEPGSENESLLAKIEHAARQASSLLDETHRFVRGKPVPGEPFDCTRVVSEVSALVEATFPRLRLPTSLPGGQVRIHGSPRLLADALVHLLLNSSEALDGKGEIRMSVETMRTGGAAIALVSVADDGPGIAPERLGEALEPGTSGWQDRTTFRTGLGLPAARAIARMMGGALELESPPAGGLTACMRLPVLPP